MPYGEYTCGCGIAFCLIKKNIVRQLLRVPSTRAAAGGSGQRGSCPWKHHVAPGRLIGTVFAGLRQAGRSDNEFGGGQGLRRASNSWAAIRHAWGRRTRAA